MLVSIITAAYNAESTIAEAIDSILNQTYTNFEYIIVNDGSADKTLKIANEYKERDTRIKIVTHENSGAGFSRNKGISIAKGELVAFLDADDIWFPQKLEFQISVYRQLKEPGFVITDMIHYEKIDINNLPIYEDKNIPINEYTDAFARMVTNSFFYQPATALVPREFFLSIGQYADDVSGQDYYPYLMFTLYGKKTVKVCEPLYGERSLTGSLQRSSKSTYYSSFAHYKAINSILTNKEKHQKHLTTQRIKLLKKGSDIFLARTIYGARKCMNVFQVLSFLISHFNSFFNKTFFFRELSKITLYPLKKHLTTNIIF